MQKYDFWTIFDPQRGHKNHLGAAFWLKMVESTQRGGKPEMVFEPFGTRCELQDGAGSDFHRFWRDFACYFDEFWTDVRDLCVSFEVLTKVFKQTFANF